MLQEEKETAAGLFGEKLKYTGPWPDHDQVQTIDDGGNAKK